mmetsp:Transcript_16213/g.50818  ORF Transcript_16213/g.50818 Transcript_16213/m.50818 type:complete len:331 (+) Transcript_16213:312-1304(+)
MTVCGEAAACTVTGAATGGADPRGVMGVRGVRGESAPRGVVAPRGTLAPRGVAGPRGVAAPRGVAGPRGVPGPRGVVGRGGVPTGGELLAAVRGVVAALGVVAPRGVVAPLGVVAPRGVVVPGVEGCAPAEPPVAARGLVAVGGRFRVEGLVAVRGDWAPSDLERWRRGTRGAGEREAFGGGVAALLGAAACPTSACLGPTDGAGVPGRLTLPGATAQPRTGVPPRLPAARGEEAEAARGESAGGDVRIRWSASGGTRHFPPAAGVSCPDHPAVAVAVGGVAEAGAATEAELLWLQHDACAADATGAAAEAGHVWLRSGASLSVSSPLVA